MKCKFCNREISNKGSLISHELVCKMNPGRVKRTRSPKAGKQKGAPAWNKGIKVGAHPQWRRKYPDDAIFVENSSYPRHALKKRILEDCKIEYRCACCDIGPKWNGKPMPLILDHINGINNDNRLENLRFVCSNCDTQLPTYKSRNKESCRSG